MQAHYYNRHLQWSPASLHPEELMKLMQTRLAKADEELKSLGYTVVSQNGQRISTKAKLDTSAMEKVKWNEVFIGKLPRDMFEDELVGWLEAYGEVYKIRYMMDFSGTNRGYCFVKYATKQQAIEACLKLDGLRVKADKPPIGVKMSFDNKVLYFGNIPSECTESMLANLLTQAGIEGVVNVRMAGGGDYDTPSGHHHQTKRLPRNLFGRKYSDMDNLKPLYRSDRFCYVYFDSHEAATRARRFLLPGEPRLFQRKLTIDWAKSDIPSDILASFPCSST